ncbi:MAG: hypothetical protein L6R42_004004 [Xanthoria sp. 1 TBL-2021]|nr:MAG: hypothetical protein L6R42_004004 [Xanthoria sp. 1 TBL-2021]
MPALPPGYTITHTTPSVETYISLRTSTGLTPFSTEAAARGLPNSLFTVQIMHEGQAVGMGRIIGDGGCFFQVTDICTQPAHRGRGLAKAVMAELTTWLERNAPKGAWVGLSADGEAGGLYRQFGFRATTEEFDSVGMARVM